MFAMTVIAEDGQLHATRDDNGEWQGFVADGHTGRQEAIHWTDAQLAAVLAVAFGGEGILPDSAVATLYPLAESAVEGLSKECRFIP